MKYQSICAKFGEYVSVPAALAVGGLVGRAIPLETIGQGFFAGLAGFMAGAFVDPYADGMLDALNVGRTAGNHLKKACQLAAYLAAMGGVCMHFNGEARRKTDIAAPVAEQAPPRPRTLSR